MLKNFKFFYALWCTSLKSSLSLKGAFLIDSTLMIANNLIFFSIWWIFFLKFDNIAGWYLKEMFALMAVGIGACGLMQINFAGVRSLSRMIINGELDLLIVQPKNLLIRLLGARSFAKGWGNLATAFILILLVNLTDFYIFSLIIIGMICGCLVFTSMGVIAHSTAFWMGSNESLSNKYLDSLYLFALYPTNIYSGYLQVIMFTIIPAGIIGYLPVELVIQFSWGKLLLLISSTLFFCFLANFVFYFGLRKYESGNQFGI